ncbi:MAG: YjjG family noncanonical pyrimidine nucleotidase [Flavobacteriia bacterium]|nr:YjjG family noncanonical pyrimidine nucleotidase [Flavobacteriia bacterium]
MYKDIVTDIFFDLDHTLWDFEKNSALTFERLLVDFEVSISLEVFLEAYIPINLKYWRMYRNGEVPKETLRYERLKYTFDQLSYHATDRLIQDMADQYMEVLTTYNHLFPGTHDLLNYLQPKYRLHIITNGFTEVQGKKMENSQIDQYFEVLVDSELAGVKKPHPKIFKTALDMAGVSAAKSLMIGDSLEADILGAKAAGLQVLHFNAHGEATHAHAPIVHSLEEIKQYL